MITVVIVGTGNVAQNLYYALKEEPQVVIKQVLGRTKSHLSFVETTMPNNTDFESVENADVYILAISDEVIPLVSKKLKIKDGLVVHTSGGTAMNSLKNHKRIGVFYPLQTFTKGKMVSFKNIPMVVEATTEEDYLLLENLGRLLSENVVRISSEKRQKLHVAAVFANNFTNYMYTLAAEVCAEHDLDFDILKPLITETSAKLSELSPEMAQTGPAKRGDQKTLHNHLAILKDKQHREIYTLLSNAIKETHGKEL